MELKVGFRHTELGLLPDGWDVKPLEDTLARGRLGGNYPNINNETSRPLMKMGNLSRGTFDTSKIQYIPEGFPVASEHILKKGDVLFNTRNTLELVGKVSIWNNELPEAYYNSNLMRLEFDPSVISSNSYANYCLNSEYSIKSLRKIATGTTSVAAIYGRDLMKFLLPIPPQKEQVAIANALSDVDSLIAKLDQLIAKKSDIKKGAMQELLTGKRRLPGFNKPWAGIRLRDIGTTYGGLSGKSKTDFENGKSHYIPFTNVMSNVTIDMNQLDKVSIKPGEVQNTIRIGDLIFNGSSETPEEVGYCSAVTQLTGDLYLNSFCFGFRPREDGKVCPLFLAYYFRGPSGRAIMSSLAQGSTRYNLSKNRLLNVELDLPDLAEQEQISAIFSDMDSEISELKSKRAKMADIKQGMMQQLLTGKIRLV